MAFRTKDSGKLSPREIWDTFMKKGTIPERSIRPDILRSWQRSRGIDPNIDPAHNQFLLSGESLNEKRAGNQELISAAEPVLKEICDIGGKYFVLLSDSSGYNLIAKSNVDYPLPIGAKCGEENIGTNAIGLALVEDQLVEVKGCEHYTSSLHSFSCSAIPIHDPSGKIAGVVCIASPDGELHSAIRGVLQLSMQAIENQLRFKDEQRRHQQTRNILDRLIESIELHVLILDQNGNILNANQKCLNLMGIEQKDTLVGRPYHAVIKDKNRSLLKGKNLEGRELEIVTKNKNVRCKVSDNGMFSNLQSGNNILLFEPISTGTAFYPAASRKISTNQVVGISPSWLSVMERSAKAAKVNSNVLIEGESGTGKELIAQSIHQESKRQGNFVPINCGAIPKGLIESELFGYEEGAFTGARKGGMIGKLQMADGGTLFLDEIGEMPPDMQVHLLRFLQDKLIMRIGGNQTKTVDVRIIAATNRNLRQAVKEGKFREDLFFRLNVIHIQLPPLRERIEDIPELVRYYTKKICCQMNKPKIEFSPAAMAILCNYQWPGNVRELINVLENLLVFNESEVIQPEALAPYLNWNEIPKHFCGNLRLYENDVIMKTLEKNGWNVSKSARELGISRNTLYNKIRKDELHRYKKLQHNKES